MIAGRAAGVYCFTIDDNICFLEECTKSNLSSIFDHPYPAMLRKMHFTYGTKFQLNMYYCYALNEFSLTDVPDIWRDELEQNSDWLRFSFHSYANDPPFPYDNAVADKVLADYRAVMAQMRRIAGKAATDVTTTLHYVCATKEACIALRKEGVCGLIGMFLPMDDSRALRYYLRSIFTRSSSFVAGIFTSDSFSKYSGEKRSSSSPLSRTLSTRLYFNAASTIFATVRFMVSVSTPLVPLIFRTNPAIAIKHCASAVSSSLSSPEG